MAGSGEKATREVTPRQMSRMSVAYHVLLSSTSHRFHTYESRRYKTAISRYYG